MEQMVIQMVMQIVIKWICNFLRQRSQQVVVDGKHSSWTHVNCGVPQIKRLLHISCKSPEHSKLNQ